MNLGFSGVFDISLSLSPEKKVVCEVEKNYLEPRAADLGARKFVFALAIGQVKMKKYPGSVLTEYQNDPPICGYYRCYRASRPRPASCCLVNNNK